MDEEYFDTVVAHKRYPGGRSKFLVKADSMEAALSKVRDREGKEEVGGVWIPKGYKIIGIGLSGYSGVLIL